MKYAEGTILVRNKRERFPGRQRYEFFKVAGEDDQKKTTGNVVHVDFKAMVTTPRATVRLLRPSKIVRQIFNEPMRLRHPSTWREVTADEMEKGIVEKDIIPATPVPRFQPPPDAY